MDKNIKKFELKHKIWLESPDGTSIFGDGKYLLLKEIEKEGSFVAAINKLDLSYRKTWNKMKEIETRLGFRLLESTRGGKTGGSSVLTAKAKILVLAFEHFHNKVDELINKAFQEFATELSKNDI